MQCHEVLLICNLGLGFRVSGFKFRVLGFGFWVLFWILGLGQRAADACAFQTDQQQQPRPGKEQLRGGGARVCM